MTTTYVRLNEGTGFYKKMERCYTGPKRWTAALPEIATLINVPKVEHFYEDGSTLRLTPDLVAEHEHLQKDFRFEKGNYIPKKNTKQGKVYAAGFAEISKKHELDYDRFGQILFIYGMHPQMGKYQNPVLSEFNGELYLKWKGEGEVDIFMTEIKESEYLELELEKAKRNEETANV